jgi:homoserine O-acetyltransferase
MSPAPLFRKLLALALLAGSTLFAQTPSKLEPAQGDYVIKDFPFAAGGSLPELRIHYRTLGAPQRDANGRVTNAILILHGTTGSGEQFISDNFSGFLFPPGGLLDAAKYYIILPDGIGHGHSSKPSDGLHARFPHYGYADMVTAQHRLLTEGLGVNHLRLLLGTSMGGMHAWMWGEKYPDFMDAVMPLASVPVQIAGRNRAWRKMAIDAIRFDPEYHDGDYTQQPHNLIVAGDLLWLFSNNPVQRQKEAPTRDASDRAVAAYIDSRLASWDANDVIYALDASRDYDPEAELGKIRAPLLAINSADDLINPPELGILEREIQHVPHGRAIVIPLSDATRGHGTHTLPRVWQQYLAGFLRETAR